MLLLSIHIFFILLREIELNEDAFVSSEPLFETSDGEEEKDKRSPAPSPSLAPANLDKQLRAKGAPQRSKEAIAAGLQLFEQGKFLEASEMFELALELPGSGVVRLAGSPKEYACPSDGEESTALYNMACCYCKLGKPDAALTCLKSLLNDTEFDNYHAIRTDPDLAPVRGTELDSLLSEHDGLFSKLFGKKKGTDSSGDRSWLQRW